MVDVKLQAGGQFSCSIMPSSSHFDLGKNKRKLSIWNIIVAEIDSRAAEKLAHEKIHGHAEGQDRMPS